MNKLLVLIALSPLLFALSLHWLSGKDFVRSPDLAMTVFFGLLFSIATTAFLLVNNYLKESDNDISR